MGKIAKRDEGTGRIVASHGMTGSPTHVTWEGMIQRCHNPNHTSHPEYGARGVTVCKRWRESFAAFVEDVGVRPSKEHTLDRFPNRAGNYEPGNVRWATRKEQHRNKMSNTLVTFRGETRCLAEWSEITGLPRNTLYKRWARGFDPERLLTQPHAPKRVREVSHCSK